MKSIKISWENYSCLLQLQFKISIYVYTRVYIYMKNIYIHTNTVHSDGLAGHLGLEGKITFTTEQRKGPLVKLTLSQMPSCSWYQVKVITWLHQR